MGSERLEAQWAAFFDRCGWPWERRTAAGMVLLLPLRPVLVTVVQVSSIDELGQCHEASERWAWDGERLLVGTGPVPGRDFTRLAIGKLTELGDPGEPEWWSEAPLIRCGICGRPSFFHSAGWYRCRVAGCYDGDHHLGDLSEVTAWWREAGTRVDQEAAERTVVYFIGAGTDGPVKVGFTAGEPERRLATLQVGCPDRLTLLGAVQGTRETEAAAHVLLARHAVRGEWFDREAALILLEALRWLEGRR